LRTGDDCDEIEFRVDYNVVSSDLVNFTIAPASGITWWKAIEIPIGSSEYRMFEIQDGSTNGGMIAKQAIDSSRPMRFWKAKAFGVHTLLSFTWNVLFALPGGSHLTLTWRRDHC
jgi:hypothetical protein